MTHYTYILRCDDDSLYTGYTTDVGRRLEQHNDGEGAKYTAGRTPVEVSYVRFHSTKSCAMSNEYRIKQLSKGQKEAKISDGEEVTVEFCTECDS